MGTRHKGVLGRIISLKFLKMYFKKFHNTLCDETPIFIEFYREEDTCGGKGSVSKFKIAGLILNIIIPSLDIETNKKIFIYGEHFTAHSESR